MAFIRSKLKKGNRYYYIVENRRDGPGGRTRQHILEYIGPEARLLEQAMGWRTAALGGATAPVASATFRSYDYGAPAALWKVAGLVGLEGILDEALPPKTVKGMSRGRVLVLAVLHRAIDPGSKAAFAGWCEGTSLPYHLGFDAREIDSQAIWEAMDGVGDDEIDAAQRAVVARLRALFPGDLGSLHLAYTNYHPGTASRSARCTVCARGHNKQKRNDLRQFSLAMLSSATLRVAIVWELYEGNKNDKSEFPDFVEKVAAEMGVEGADYTVPFDGGGNSREALSGLPFRFVCGHSMAGLKHLYDIDVDLYEEVDIGGGHTRRAHRVDNLEFSGVKGTGVLTLSDDLYRGEADELEKKEAKLRAAAADLGARLKKPRSTLYTRLREARERAEGEAAVAERYNEQLAADKERGERRRCRKRAVPTFDEEAAMRKILESELFKGRACLRKFWRAEVTRDEEGRWGVSVARDDEAREAYCRKMFGKKLTVTNRTEWSTADILAAYAAQESVEDLFKTTKDTDHFSMRPQWHWTDDKIRMHVFMCLCAVMLAEVLRRLLADSAGVTLTKHALLDRLANIHDGWVIVDGKPRRAIEDLGTQERRLLDAVRALPGETLGHYDG